MSLYDFELPEALIAQAPAHPRDHARLLVYRLNSGEIIDDYFYNIDKYLAKDTAIALNNSKVENCRLLFDEGKTEIFILEKLDTNTIRALVRPGKKFGLGKRVVLTDWLKCEVTNINDEGIRTLKLNVTHDDPRLKQYEHVPLPPYIKQNDKLASEYQTVYAKPPGSLAAPTAGLHFTDKLLDELGKKHQILELTLHVSLGTFAKLTEKNLETGRLHEEMYYIDRNVAKTIDDAKHITAVGTTSVRTLESYAKTGSTSGGTDIFIRPGYKFGNVNSLVTNFHLPSTSLFMLVAAFIADKKELDEESAAKELRKIYKHAVSKKYRFYSFGDAMLIV